jgi:NAD(P)H-flavin reductase
MTTYGVTVFKIVHAVFIAPGIKRFVLEAPRIARRHKPGQFVILRLYEKGERVPLTIERSDPERGTINIVVQSAGKTTHLLNSFETGDHILDVVGPSENLPKSKTSARWWWWLGAWARPWRIPPQPP